MADWSGAEAYSRSFARLCAGAVPAVLDELGEPRGRLLDVGTGPGTLALQARSRGWRVTASEPEAAMRDLARRAGLDPVDAALPSLPFPERAFDAVAANFVVNHLDDPRAGAAELTRVTAPGGAVAVTIWGSGPAAPSTLWAAVLDGADVPPLPGLRLPPERDFARTEAGLGSLLERAGLEGVRTRTVPVAGELDRDDLWSAVEAGIGVIGATWRAQPAEGRARLRASYESLAPAPVIRLPTEAVLGAGRRPR